MYKKISDADTENELKETFRVFSKDNEGEDNTKMCIINIHTNIPVVYNILL